MTELIRPLLAAKVTDAEMRSLPYPVLASYKIDGIRALVCNAQLRTRSMKLIPNRATQSRFGKLNLEGLDGELVVGNPYDFNLMQQCTSGLMSHAGDPKATFHVFDYWPGGNVSFHERLKLASDIAAMSGDYRVVVVTHRLIHSYDALMEYEAEALRLGYEGIMIRSLRGKYKQNRSTVREGILLKVKRFVDGDAIVIGTEALLRNLNEAQMDERGYTKRSSAADGKVATELLGSLRVRDLASGAEFGVGSGFTEAQRRDLWKIREHLLGKIIVYKSFPIGVKDAPRIGTFKSFRSKLDM